MEHLFPTPPVSRVWRKFSRHFLERRSMEGALQASLLHLTQSTPWGAKSSLLGVFGKRHEYFQFNPFFPFSLDRLSTKEHTLVMQWTIHCASELARTFTSSRVKIIGSLLWLHSSTLSKLSLSVIKLFGSYIYPSTYFRLGRRIMITTIMMLITLRITYHMSDTVLSI